MTPNAEAIRHEQPFSRGDEAAEEIIAAVGDEGIGARVGKPAARQ